MTTAEEIGSRRGARRATGASAGRDPARILRAGDWSEGLRPDFVRYYQWKRSARRRLDGGGAVADAGRDPEHWPTDAGSCQGVAAGPSACNLATDRPEASEGLQGSPGSKCLIFKRTRTPAAQLDFSDFSEKIRGVVRFCVFFYPFSPTYKKREEENTMIIEENAGIRDL